MTEEEYEEHKQALADRDWWQRIANEFGWELSGWTNRNTAHFIVPSTRNGESLYLSGFVGRQLHDRIDRLDEMDNQSVV